MTVAVAVVLVAGAVFALGRTYDLRVLVPAWRFFDRADEPPSLWIEREGEWRLVRAPRRGPFAWAFAPASNLALAYQSTIDRFVAEVSELDPELPDDDPAIVELRSYGTVCAIAREHVPAGVAFRWKIVAGGSDFVTSGAQLA